MYPQAEHEKKHETKEHMKVTASISLSVPGVPGQPGYGKMGPPGSVGQQGVPGVSGPPGNPGSKGNDGRCNPGDCRSHEVEYTGKGPNVKGPW